MVWFWHQWMNRTTFLFFCLFWIPASLLAEDAALKNNPCAQKLEEATDYRAIGVYGSLLNQEFHPVRVYILIKEMKRFGVVSKEFSIRSEAWHFDFVETTGKHTFVFVYHEVLQEGYCNSRPNAFVVEPKSK